MCCYFSIDEKHDYYLQAWSLKESRESKEIELNLPDIICVRYNQMRIFPGNLVHTGGFNNTSSNGNFRTQLLIIEEGQRNYYVTKFHNKRILFENDSDDALSLYNYGENDHKYNNRRVRNYSYTTVTNIDFCNVKTYTGVDLIVKNNSQIFKKLMFPYYRNDIKLNPNLLSDFKDYHNEEYKNPFWNTRKDYRGQQFNLNYKEPTLLENKIQIIDDNNKLVGNINK